MKTKKLIRKHQLGNILESIKGKFKKRIYDTINPSGGYDIPNAIKNFILNNKRHITQLEPDLQFATYLNIPIQNRHYKQELQKSIYRPTKNDNKQDIYYTINLSDKNKQDIINYSNGLTDGFSRKFGDYKYNPKIMYDDYGHILYDGTPLKDGESKQSINIGGYHNLGTYTISKGRDNKGEYVSYYDSWDLNPFKGLYGDRNNNFITKLFGINNKEDILPFGNPVKFYDRIYLDDYYNIDNNNRGHHYLPEVTIYPNPDIDIVEEYLNKKKINNENK